MTDLKLIDIRKSYGSVGVLHGINLEVAQGEFVVFVGPSGCGKSTLLRMIAGLETTDHGRMELDGSLLNDVPPAKRGVAMVFQSYALYPHMSVYDNMAFSLKLAKTATAEIERRVREAAEILQITPLLKRLPRQLSGGQRQRVAIGRAITRNPRLFLFDEPLSNLDAALRVATRVEIAQLKAKMPGTTMIYVTHDQVEAMTLADRIVVMNAGRIEQIGTPIELYETPANQFVAGFIGSPAMNFVPADVRQTGSGLAAVTKDGFSVPLSGKTGSDQLVSVTLGIRPEDVYVAHENEPGLTAKAIAVERLGEATLAYLDMGNAKPFVAKLPRDSSIAVHDVIRIASAPKDVHIFDKEGLRV